MRKLFVLIVFLVSLCAVARAEVFMVDPDGGEYRSLTEVLAIAGDGDEILLAGGVYEAPRETFPLAIDHAVRIRAQAGEVPIIQSPIKVAAVEITAPGVRIEGVSIHFLYSGIRVLADDASIVGCRIMLADEAWRTSSCGLWVGGAKRLTLTGNEFLGCGMALAGPPISDESKDKPVLTGMFEVGEDIEFFTTHTMDGNLVNGRPLQYLVGLRDTSFTDASGQVIAVACENVSFDDLDVSRASIGMSVVYCKDIRINRAVADDCGIFGIYLAKSERCEVKEVHANGCAHGVDVRAVDYSVIADCVTNACGQGVFLSWTQSCLVTGCEMNDNGTGFFAATGNNNRMDNCQVNRNEIGLYVQDEPLFSLTNSAIARNTACGVRVTRGGLLCAGNLFEANWVGSMALHCNPVTYQGNTFSGNVNRSLYVKDSEAVMLIDNQYAKEDMALQEWIDSEKRTVWGEG